MLTCETFQSLKDALSERLGEGPLSLREFGKILGRAVDRRPYTKSYMSELLRGKKVITPRVEKAARILLLGVAGLDDARLTDPMPRFEGGPVARMQAARARGVKWQELYVGDQDVRAFVDTLVELILRG